MSYMPQNNQKRPTKLKSENAQIKNTEHGGILFGPQKCPKKKGISEVLQALRADYYFSDASFSQLSLFLPSFLKLNVY